MTREEAMKLWCSAPLGERGISDVIVDLILAADRKAREECLTIVKGLIVNDAYPYGRNLVRDEIVAGIQATLGDGK